MTNIELRPVLAPDQSADEQKTLARTVQRLVYEDMIRVGATEEEARSVADPSDDERVGTQLGKLQHPPVRGTEYRLVTEAGIVSGFVKTGPWLPGDEKPFGILRRVRAELNALTHPEEDPPVGLHAFAVRPGLASAALAAVYYDLVPPTNSLNAAVHENDDELHAAFTELGGSHGPEGKIKLGEYVAKYVLRTLPTKS